MVAPVHVLRNAHGARSAGAVSIAGFTLVELMVVITIVGLMGAAVALTLPSAPAALERDAATFGAHLVRAQQEAILSTRAVEVTVDARGYRFTMQRFDDWQPLDGAAFRPVAWSAGVRPRLKEREHTVVQFDPTGRVVPTTLELEDGQASARVSVDGAGRVRVNADAR